MKTNFLRFGCGVALSLSLSLSLSQLVSCSREVAVDDVSQATVEILNEQEQALLADLQAINDGLLTDLHTRANEVPYNPDKIETFDDMSKGWKVAYKDAKGAWGGWKVGSKAGALAGPHSAVVVGVCSGIIVGVVASVLEYTEGVVVPTGYDELIASGKLRDPKFVYGHYLKIDKSQIGLLRREAGVSINTPQYARGAMVGADHNALVEKLKTANINEHPVIPQSDPFYEVLNSPDFIAEYQAIVDELLNNPNATTTAEDYEEYGYSPVAAEVIELFSQSFVRYPIQVKGIDTVIDRYVTTIEASGNVLTKDDKLAIYAGFSTAAFSPRHWATKM